MDPRQLATFAADEPHLLAAICTIASKDEGQWWHLHEVMLFVFNLGLSLS